MSRARILVVDDQAGMLRAVERVLASSYEVRCALSPGEALAQLAEFVPDLALLDVRLPEMSGFVLMERMRSLRPDLDVLLMTGSVNELDSQLIRAIAAGAFYFIQKPFDRQVLLTLVQRCLTLRRLSAENRVHTRRLEQELAQARIFQQRLLPPGQAQLAGFRVHARYLPCVELCGDFYDYAAVDADRLALLVADVSGHGVSAAMLTGMVKSAFRTAEAEAFDPRAVVGRLFDGLRAFGPRQFVTALAMRLRRLNSEAAEIEYCSAGHPAALVGAPGAEPRVLADTGPLICAALDAASWDVCTARLGRGERLLALTDGLLDWSAGTESFGSARVAAALQTSRTSGEPLLQEITTAAEQFAAGGPRDDDVTLLTVAIG